MPRNHSKILPIGVFVEATLPGGVWNEVGIEGIGDGFVLGNSFPRVRLIEVLRQGATHECFLIGHLCDQRQA